MNKFAQFAREFALITLSCFGAGVVIGAADGAAMYFSAGLRPDFQEPAPRSIHDASFWAMGAAFVGGITAVFLGLPLYYLLFDRTLSRSEFALIAGASLLGGAVFCAALGRSIMEWCWLATPCFAVLASVLVRVRQLREKI